MAVIRVQWILCVVVEGMWMGMFVDVGLDVSYRSTLENYKDSLTCIGLHERISFGNTIRAVKVTTRDPHGAVCLEHHGVLVKC